MPLKEQNQKKLKKPIPGKSKKGNKEKTEAAAIRMITDDIIPIKARKGRAKPGGSKLGGYPDFPAGLKWPEKFVPELDAKGPLAFICQINFAEFKNDFASKGMLYFFTIPAPDDLGNEHAVIFYDGDEKLSARKIDLEWLAGLVDAKLPLPEYRLVFNKKDFEGGSHLFGKGNYIQENIEEENDHKLLLQIDARQFDDIFQYICSEDGAIYFLIPDKDLKKKKFQNAYAVMQFA